LTDKFRNKFRVDSIRLQNWDYSRNAAYYITICTQNREPYFGKIANRNMNLSDIGELANKFWKEIPDHFSFVYIDAFVIMPNHIHGILIIDNPKNERKNETVEDMHDGRDKAMPCLYNTGTQKISGLSPGQKRFRNQGKNTLSSIIGSYKSIVTKYARKINPEFTWQPRFYDHVIRNDESMTKIRFYINNNSP